MDQDCVQFVPFSHYDWTFARQGWLPWNPTAFCLIASVCAVAYWMSIELLLLVYVTFKRHTGIYFWSIIITTLGIILQTTGYILKSFENSWPVVLVAIICKIGWVANVTGFSIVLWSRLHLVVRSPRILKWLLVIILVDGLVCHTPVVVFEFGLMTRHHDTYYRPMQIMERIQQTVFTLQETAMSCLYIYHTRKFLKIGYPLQTRKVIGLLLIVQLLVIALDAVLTLFDYTDKFTLKCTLHPLVYSIKLKLEFIVLNQLQSLVKGGLTPGLGLGAAEIVQREAKFNHASPSLSQSPSPSASPRVATPQDQNQQGRNPKPAPRFETGFVIKAGRMDILEVGLGQTSPGESMTDSIESEGERIGKRARDSDQTLMGGEEDAEEHDLKNVVGRADDLVVEREDDMERQYLGRWSGGRQR
ncbi:hypothetical protein ONS95_003555 [Cadophora gregata]|uniref:uncharacterized protein n=1 Tax=Cadophora gregata TaxID=51156 RepID=UPI0026DC8E77|nr:uncharacterized protein ONS95_003555 [Cadophora gregata]KAK0099372.1 hypothetical protein ONS96_008401 [Cadophora gregata f. sp. sojae]KAK0106832.1 hypothetical protein ONS95_003555 [Cadophora gregata]